jgi:hypothetical protein
MAVVYQAILRGGRSENGDPAAPYFVMRVVPVSIAEPGMNVPRTCKYRSKFPLGRVGLNRPVNAKTAPK